MQKPKSEVSCPLNAIENGLILEIFPENRSLLFEIDEQEAKEAAEAPIQILEGHSYEYKISKDTYRLKCDLEGIVIQSRRDQSAGRIVPNIYVGTLTVYVYHEGKADALYPVTLEVLATKFNNEPDKSYRENYRYMLEDITKKCTELLMQINSPVHQNFETDFEKDNQTIYQRFSFVRSLVNSDEFNEAIQKIISSPKTNWAEETEMTDTRRIRRFNNSTIRQLTTQSNRINLSDNHYLVRKGLNSVPVKINNVKKTEIVDNPENRFIKHSLEVYLKFCENCSEKFPDNSREKKEAEALVKNLENQLNHNFFKEISRPDTLKLNSPVLQRKAGYREVLNTWLMFDLAPKIIWKGGDQVYEAGKRDIAVLYEYWLFFTLYDLFKDKFRLDKHTYEDKAYEHLIESTADGLNVMVKAGRHTAIEGVCDFGSRKLRIKYSYNRSFKGGRKYEDKQQGSWTSTLRPDYTLSFWPSELKESEAEAQELIVHIHFDAKYKVTQFSIGIDETSGQDNSAQDLEKEELEERKGIYKNIDLLKMHAYKDAIRRTGGAYILYPGSEQKTYRGFHELIPGLGAFALKPAEDKSGLKELADFIDQVVNHLIDRASQRERLSTKVYEIYKNKKEDDDILNEPLPEYFDDSHKEKIIPDETYVIVGYSNDPKKLKWNEEKGLYNFRMDENPGSLQLDNAVVNAKYLLLRTGGSDLATKIYKIISKGPKVFSKEQLIRKQYPGTPSQEYYLVIEIKKTDQSEFENAGWKFKDLEKYKEINKTSANKYSSSGIPFTVSLTELMKVVER